MIIIVTGKTSSGKTSILKEVSLPNTFYLDSHIKNNWYIKGHKLYSEIEYHFGSNVVDGKKVITSELGKIVFNDANKLNELNSIVFPYIKSWISSMNNAIIEMAIYMNHEREFRGLVDKVILIKRDKLDTKGKFLYLDKELHPIENSVIKYDYLINNNNSIKKAAQELNKVIKKIL